MTPYFERAGITIYHGDCRVVAPALEHASMDLLIADPPYGVAWQSSNRAVPFDVLAGDDGTVTGAAVLALCLPSLRTYRHVYCFGLTTFGALPLTGAAELIWDKERVGLGDLSLPWGPAHERILFGVYVPSKANRDHGDGRLAARLRRGSVLRVPRKVSRAVRDHPTEKPVALLRQLIESSSLPGERVLDPTMGIGSTLVAAYLEGRQATGIEINERFCEVAAQRLRQAVLPSEQDA